MSVQIIRPSTEYEKIFIAAAKRSKRLHAKWVSPPTTAKGYKQNVLDKNTDKEPLFLIVNQNNKQLIGCVDISNVAMGNFRSGYLGYYAFEPFAGKGLMKSGLSKVINHCFKKMKLHRLEANIQPKNESSIALVKSLGFRNEGYSPKYLKVRGKWQDHERWAILKEEWNS